MTSSRETSNRPTETTAQGPDRYPPNNRPERPIRSFVLREGRMTAGQARAFDRLWPSYGIQRSPGEILDLQRLFALEHGRPEATVLEIGFGNGDALATMAAAAPRIAFIGVEVHRPGIGHLLLQLERRGLTNVRVAREDAQVLLAEGLPSASLDGVNLFFPDPWPKRRHHKRRIVQPPFLDRLARALRPGGVFHAATDWLPYAEQMLALLDGDDRFENPAGSGRFAPDRDHRPPTKFERRGARLGHPVRDLIVIRR